MNLYGILVHVYGWGGYAYEYQYTTHAIAWQTAFRRNKVNLYWEGGCSKYDRDWETTEDLLPNLCITREPPVRLTAESGLPELCGSQASPVTLDMLEALTHCFMCTAFHGSILWLSLPHHSHLSLYTVHVFIQWKILVKGNICFYFNKMSIN